MFVAAVLLAFSCGDESGPTNPEQTVQIDLTIDWPLARQDGFTDARWELWKHMDTQHDNVLVKGGRFSRSGVARVRYTATCHVGGFVYGYDLAVYGHFEGAEQQCGLGVSEHCTSEPQTYTVPLSTHHGCEPPSS